MNKLGLYIFMIIVSGMLSETKAQQISESTPASTFEKWRDNNLQEKIYVHLDKNIYITGEIAWFKIYYVDGSFHRPLQLSEIAYAELLDHSNKPVLQTMISLKKSGGNGSFLIPKELNSGYYKLRCYTQWMRNFDAHFFFEKQITVINAEQTGGDSSLPAQDIYDLGFFPEGGNLLNGIENKIAFHISNQYGNVIDGNGIILDGGKDTVAHFKTIKLGMGHFLFTPVSGHVYLAKMVLSNGKSLEKQLPSSSDNGITIKISEEASEKIRVNIISQDPLNAPVYLFAHTRGAIKTATLVTLTNGQGNILVDKNTLEEGITHFTVFRNYQPVSERLYFIFPRKQFEITATADATEYGTRKKIKIHVRAGDDKNSATPSKISAAIYRLDSLQEPDQMNIQNYLLLTSDLGGYIESPSWYFNDNGPEKTEAMDDLMLTQGWRRFKWIDIQQQPNPVWQFAPEYQGEIISARITNNRSGSLMENVPVFLSLPGTNTNFWSSRSDAEGVANFEVKNSFGNREFIIQSSDSNSSINFISPFSTKFSGYPLPVFNGAKSDAGLNKKNLYVQVQHAYHEKMLDSFVIDRNVNEPFYLKPDFTYQLDRFTRFSTMEEVLREYVREVNVVNYGGSFHLHVMNGITRMPFQTDPLILLDGVAMLDINKFMNYDPFKIKSIEIVARKYFLGNISYFGIVDCKTYKGDMDDYALDPRSVIVDFDGLQQQREFYSPSYETQQQYASRLPDFRTLLYWNPSLKSGNDDIEFFSSDAAGRYVAVIQGISDKGIPAVTSLYFTVKK